MCAQRKNNFQKEGGGGKKFQETYSPVTLFSL